MPAPVLPIIGEKFNKLTVIEHVPKIPYQTRKVKCLCDCGNETIIDYWCLKSGHTKSCGCIYEHHGQSRINGKSTFTQEYRAYHNMHTRCYRKSAKHYPRYSGRGIIVCERWHSFNNFFEDMGKSPSLKHSLDRIDNDGNYEPSNCRWGSPKQQARNRSNNHFVIYKGKTKCLKEWGEQYGICPRRLGQRMKLQGWSFEKAVTEPIRPTGRKPLTTIINA